MYRMVCIPNPINWYLSGLVESKEQEGLQYCQTCQLTCSLRLAGPEKGDDASGKDGGGS